MIPADNGLVGTKPDSLTLKAIEAFQGRDILLFEELPPHIPPTTIVSLVRRRTLRIVEVKRGKRKKLAWRLVH